MIILMRQTSSAITCFSMLTLYTTALYLHNSNNNKLNSLLKAGAFIISKGILLHFFLFFFCRASSITDPPLVTVLTPLLSRTISLDFSTLTTRTSLLEPHYQDLTGNLINLLS